MILEELSNAFGPSGFEDDVRNIILDEIHEYVDNCEVDYLGNIIALKKGKDANLKTHKVMIAAHMDEVGLMITHADSDGFLHFINVGGINERCLLAQGVKVGPKKIGGVILAKPVHLMKPSERTEYPVSEDMIIDIGAASKEEAEKKITEGDYAVFDTEYSEFGTRCISGKAFDDRMGCAALIELIKRGPFPFDCYFVFSTMEEIGGRGAKVAAYGIKPDIAFVLEGTVCDDGPTEKDCSPTTKLGLGPAITIADRSAISNKQLIKHLIDIAKKEGIPFQFKQPGIGGTDAGTINITGEGIPCVALAVPCRYIHSPVAVASLDDFKNMLILTEKALKNLTMKVIKC